MNYFKIFFLLTLSYACSYATPIKIMPLGDSITYDQVIGDTRPESIKTGYRSHLWYLLQNNNYDVNFVGSQRAGWTVSPPFDPDNEGYPGWSSYQISNMIYSKLVTYKPNVVLLHVGSNDWDSSTSGINTILNHIDTFERRYKQTVTVIIAKIINRTIYQSWIRSKNINIVSLVSQRKQQGDTIHLVDMEYGAGLQYSSRDFYDYVHPNSRGYKKMANVWFDALEKLIPQRTIGWLPPVLSILLDE